MLTAMYILLEYRRQGVCGRLFAGIVGSNPVGGMNVCLSWVLCPSGCNLYVGLTTRPKESYGMWCVKWLQARSPMKRGHALEARRKSTRKKYVYIYVYTQVFVCVCVCMHMSEDLSSTKQLYRIIYLMKFFSVHL
jgi:hypothetical protein